MAEYLRQSDEAKKAFIADVTHELRTPLTVIKGTIETLEDGALDDHEGRGPLLTSMQRETDRLIRLVNELLVLTAPMRGRCNWKSVRWIWWNWQANVANCYPTWLRGRKWN